MDDIVRIVSVLPSKRIRYDNVFKTGMEILIYIKNEEEIESIYASVLDGLANIFASEPGLKQFEDLFVRYSFETGNSIYVLDIDLDR